VKVPLLVDTGASYTTLPVKVLNDLGYDTQNPDNWHPGIVTGRGHTSRIPIVQVSSFSCLGKQIIDWPILAYTLPQPTYWRGVLGMDFLIHFRAVILLENSQTGQADRIVLR
jgi:aspartyl protease family protein